MRGEPQTRILAGDGLKVGGEGMKVFYDKIVPNAVRDLLKKLKTGAEMGTVQMALGKRLSDDAFGENDTRIEEARGEYGERGYRTTDGAFFDSYADAVDHEQAIAAVDIEMQEQPGFDVTDQMRAVAGEGLPLFANKARPAPLQEESRWQAFRRTMQDDLIHVNKIQQMLVDGGGTVGELQDVYKAEERMHGRSRRPRRTRSI